jgi:hypothetical protein
MTSKKNIPQQSGATLPAAAKESEDDGLVGPGHSPSSSPSNRAIRPLVCSALLTDIGGIERKEPPSCTIDDDEQDVPDEWIDFEKSALSVKASANHVRMGLRVLKEVLVAMYKSPTILPLIKGWSDHGVCINFSKALTAGCQKLQWTRSTSRKVLQVLRKLLIYATIPKSFGVRIKFVWDKATHHNPIIGKKYGKFSADRPERLLVESWVEEVRANTRNNSAASLRNIINFFISGCLSHFDLDIESWPVDFQAMVHAKMREGGEEFIRKICGTGKAIPKRVKWLQYFLTYVCKSEFLIPAKLVNEMNIRVIDEMDDGTDHHRISAADLDKIYKSAKKNVFDQLAFLLMISTGMRIGGVSKIKTKCVATHDGTSWNARKRGQVMEKGNKLLRFTIQPKIQRLVEIWLAHHRPGDPSPYLFPGSQTDHVSTATIRTRFDTYCMEAGVCGANVHPHSLRHSFAHIMLEADNPTEQVAKLLNHKSSATTAEFYLKENADQINARLNMPWKTETKKRKPEVPEFFAEVFNDAKAPSAKKRRKKKHKMVSQLSQLCDLKCTSVSSRGI